MAAGPIRKLFSKLAFRGLVAWINLAGVRTGSQALNFLWLNLDLPAKPDPEDGSIRQPLPPKYIENVRKAGADNPSTDVVLWVDSKRLTRKQLDFLKGALERDRPNVHLRDLRTIAAYDREKLYNEAETDPNWRSGGQSTVIWRQVDAAKILVSLQGNYDQSFFADLDHAHLRINSTTVQTMLKKHGLMIGSAGAVYCSIENQLWGFTPGRRDFFETYYADALKAAYAGHNAYGTLRDKVADELEGKEKIPLAEFCLPIGSDGSRAVQPGHAWRTGWGSAEPPATVDKDALARAFNGNTPGGLSTENAGLTAVTNADLQKMAANAAGLPPPSAANVSQAGL